MGGDDDGNEGDGCRFKETKNGVHEGGKRKIALSLSLEKFETRNGGERGAAWDKRLLAGNKRLGIIQAVGFNRLLKGPSDCLPLPSNRLN